MVASMAQSQRTTTRSSRLSGLRLDGHEAHWESDVRGDVPSLSLHQHLHGHLKLSIFFSDIVFHRAQASLFDISKTMSKFMVGHMMFHDNIAINERHISNSLVSFAIQETSQTQ